MKKYYAWARDAMPTIVEVESESESSVVINGRRRNKRSDICGYFDSFEEWKRWKIDYLRDKIKSTQIRITSLDEYEVKLSEQIKELEKLTE